MGFPGRVALATKNPGKIEEIMRICRGWPVVWTLARNLASSNQVSVPSLWPDVEETGTTYLENALLKAKAVAKALQMPAVADDSGIEVDALGGGPGLLSARFAGPNATEEENLRLLIERVRAVGPPDRSARYRCVAVCAWPDGRHLSAEGSCEGRLVIEPRGTGGFGYDPPFVPSGERRTMAELSAEEKDRISHRGRAFRRLGDLLAADP